MVVTLEDQPHFKVIQKKMGQWLTLEGTDDVDLKGFCSATREDRPFSREALEAAHRARGFSGIG